MDSAGARLVFPAGVTGAAPMSIEDLWYKNAIIYCVDVEKYQDTNGDGVGDFEGLSRRLPYLAGLGVTCLWLLPFWDDLSLPERECARTAMQWTDGPYGGFSSGTRVVVPTIDDPEHGFAAINVGSQRKDPDSLLNQVERMIRMRRECQEISWGDYTVLETSAHDVLALRYDWRGTSLVVLHNFSGDAGTAEIDVQVPRGERLVDVFDGGSLDATSATCTHRVPLDPYGYRWFRVGAADTTLCRA